MGVRPLGGTASSSTIGRDKHGSVREEGANPSDEWGDRCSSQVTRRLWDDRGEVAIEEMLVRVHDDA